MASYRKGIATKCVQMVFDIWEEANTYIKTATEYIIEFQVIVDKHIELKLKEV